MSKKNLPNIPIYIGDWERDCNVLNLESEAAWMRIVFKLWTKGKQNSIKIPTNSLQNLWRCSPEKMREILDDMIFNDIAEIVETSGFIEFTCRRFVKENEISEIRSKAVSNRKDRTKTKKKNLQNAYKNEQNTDNDIDYENKNENKRKRGVGEKTDSEDIVFPFSSEEFKDQWQVWKQFKKKEFNFSYKSTISEQAALKKLSELSDSNEKKAIAIIHQSISEGWKGLFNLKTNGNRTNSHQKSDGDLKRSASAAVDKMFGREQQH